LVKLEGEQTKEGNENGFFKKKECTKQIMATPEFSWLQLCKKKRK